MQLTRDLLMAALLMLLVAGWLVAGRVGVGVALAVSAVAVGAFALLREVDTTTREEQPRTRGGVRW